MSDECCAALHARGLIFDGACSGCGALSDTDCAEDCDSDLCETHLTATGELALRLDSAARALTGVSV